MDSLKSKIRSVPDFPKAGILFYDITTLLRDPEGFQSTIEALARPFEGRDLDVVVGVESRGFILGGAVADRLGAGFAPVRKRGKLPSKTVQETYDLEYGTDCPRDSRGCGRAGQRVRSLTSAGNRRHRGGDNGARPKALRQVESLAFLVELEFLNGRAKLPHESIYSVLKYSS